MAKVEDIFGLGGEGGEVEEVGGEAIEAIEKVQQEGTTVSVNGATVTLRLPADLWEVGGSPGFEFETDGLSFQQFVALHEKWVNEVVTPLREKYADAVEEARVQTQRDEEATEPQKNFLRSLVKKAGSSEELIQRAKEALDAGKSATSALIDELNSGEASQPTQTGGALACETCGATDWTKPASAKSSREDYYNYIKNRDGKFECWPCRKNN